MSELFYERINLAQDHIDLDGTIIKGAAVGTDIKIDGFGEDVHKVTLSIYTRAVEVSPRALMNSRITVHDHDE